MSRRSIRSGALASAALALFYVVVVTGASGSWDHLAGQARQDWYYLVAIILGFGAHVALPRVACVAAARESAEGLEVRLTRLRWTLKPHTGRRWALRWPPWPG